MYLLAFCIGGLSNLIVEYKANNGLEMPRKLKTKVKLGFIMDIIIGGLAGVLFVAVLQPEDTVRTFIIAAVGGFGGMGTIERIGRLNGVYKDEKTQAIKDAKTEKLD